MYKTKQFRWFLLCLSLVFFLSSCFKPQPTEKTTEEKPVVSGAFYKTGSKYNYIIIDDNTFIYHPNEIEKVEGTFDFSYLNEWSFSFLNHQSIEIKVIYIDENSIGIYANQQQVNYYKQDYGHVFEMSEDNGVITFPGTHKEYMIRLDNDITFKVNSTTFDMHTVMLNIGNREISLMNYVNDGRLHTLRTNEKDLLWIIKDEGFYETESPTQLRFNQGVLSWDWFSLSNPFYGFDVYANGELLETTFDYNVIIYENNFKGIRHNSPVEFVVVAKGDRYFADSKPAVLNAIYQTPTFNISFHHNDGSNNITMKETENYKIPVFTPERAGYVFNAWYVSYDNGQTLLYDWSSTMNVSRDLDLYAEWVVAQPNVVGRTLLRSPALSTFGTQLSWRHIEGARGYRVVVTSSTHDVLDDFETQSTSFDYMFYMNQNPYLMVRVTALGSENNNTINSQPSTRVLYPLSTQSSIQFNYNINTNVITWQEEFSSYVQSTDQIEKGMSRYGNYAYLDRSLDVGDYTLQLDNGAIFNYTNRTLPMPKNVLITYDLSMLNISFDEVEASNLYDIVIDGTVYSTALTHLSVPLIQDHMYAIQIIARDTTANYFKSYPFTLKIMISGDYTFESYGNNELELIHYNGDLTNLVLDESYGGKALTVIGSYVLNENSKVTKLTLPKTVYMILDYAFYNIPLEDIVIPNDSNLSFIGQGAFNAVTMRIMYFPNDRVKMVSSFNYDIIKIAINETSTPSNGFDYRGISKNDVKTYQDDFDYIVQDNEITIIKGYQKDFVLVPESIEGIPVKYIANYAFASNVILKMIYIPTSIEELDSSSIEYQTLIYTAHPTQPDTWYFYRDSIVFGINNIHVDETSGIIFNIKNNQAYVLGTTYTSRIVIPSSVLGVPVVGIDEYAFSSHHTLKSLYIPHSITDFSGLNQVLAYSILYFEGQAPTMQYPYYYKIYEHVALSSIYIHENNVEYFVNEQQAIITAVHTFSPTIFNIPGYTITAINDFAFTGVRSNDVLILPSTLVTISDNAFLFAHIQSIYVPAQITRIFLYNVSALYTESLNISSQWQISNARVIWVFTPQYIKNDGVSYEYIQYSNSIVITRYYGEETSIILPSEFNGIPVTHIAMGVFRNYFSTLKELYIPSSVISIQIDYYQGDYYNMTVYIANTPDKVNYPNFHPSTTVVWNYNPVES